MNEKAVKAIQHVTAAALADDSETAVVELDKAGELIDELVQEHQDGPEGEEEEKEIEEEQPEEDEPEEEEGGVRAKVGEKVETMKESVPTPPTPLALAGLGVVAALAAFGALKALSGRSEE
jgi:hypothetical protein